MSIAHLDPVEATRGSDTSRKPPQDIAAEQSVLGGMMLSKDAIADVVEILRGQDFYRPAHETIYEAIIDLYGRGEPADAVTVSDELTKRAEINRIGGPAYLHELIQTVPTAANAGYYAEIVAERAVLRRLVNAGTKIVQLGYGSDGEVEDLVNQAQAEVYAVAERRTAEDYVVLKDVMESTVDEIEASGHRGEGMVGVPTGFYELDELTHGLHPGQMIVIAARPAVGKSTFALDFARSAAIKHNLATVMFSLEMGRNEIAMRLLSAEATISLQDLRKGTIKDEQWSKIATTMGRMNDAPLFIDDSPNMSLMEIRAKCRRLKQQHDLKLVILDYLQLMSSGKKVESRQQEVSEFSRALKLLAKELQVPVIALSQLNRGSEQRQDKRPMVSDLRESGSIEQDADMVILLHREDVYDKESPRAGEADILVAKHRNGPTKDIVVAFQGHYSRFANMAGDAGGGGGF
ncbi:replicative DNA helicase [Pseudarthrobacter defluvii]|uniref:replicative DNA helicase n=1 Tax=Pseudarthrobacter defluvii TaxID=410837 RepID=UPI0027837AC1|nr:replicative DNA helicase [Pseudarthrobacter defluvii]MDQ0771354.1 replicative DNA helicase [Pseudarthrobacter defluvii]